MLQNLKIIETILIRNGFIHHADSIKELIEFYKSDKKAFWSQFNSNEAWGGAGSLVDISLAAYSSQPESIVKKDENDWRCAFINLYNEMIHNGIENDRAKFIIKAFKSWNDQKIGI